MFSEKIVFFYEYLGFFKSLFALFLSLFEIKTCFAIQSKSCVFSNTFLLQRGIQRINFENLKDLDFGILYGDLDNSIANFIDSSTNDTTNSLLIKITKNIDSVHYFKCFLRQQAAKSIDRVKSYKIFIEETYPNSQVIISSIHKDKYITSLLTNQNKKYINIAPHAVIIYFFGMINVYAARIVKKIFTKRKANIEILPQSSTGHIDSEIIYFPHQGIKYAGLFHKDHFYDENTDSPLHPNNILHIEHTVWDTVESRNQIVLKHPSPFDCVREAKQIFSIFLNSVPFRNILTVQHISSFFAILSFCILHRTYVNSLNNIKKAKIAIIGYDILFPATLSFALKLKHIKTIASQERYSPPVLLKFGICIDEYLCCSAYTAKLLPKTSITNCTPIGMVRTDLLLKYKKRSFKNKITVLDFHSLDNQADSERNMLLNWKNNNAFYLDIVALALQFPDIEFLIRGKDVLWWNLPYFAKTRNTIENLSNISVDTNYDELNRSYMHCAESRLVIAKYNSLADECLALNIPVIIHDYAPTLKATVSSAFNYLGADIFATSLESLITKTQEALDDPTSAILPAHIHEELFGDLNDGMVTSKVRSHTLALLESSRNATPAL